MHNKDAVELLRVHQVGLEAKVLAVGTAKAVQRAFRRPFPCDSILEGRLLDMFKALQ